MRPIFITGIGTEVGKTIAAAIVTEALATDYWKPVQSGFSSGTDSLTVQQLVSPLHSKVYPETYKLFLPASPHIAARQDSISVNLDRIVQDLQEIEENRKGHPPLVIEGAGGILVPLNEMEFVSDLIARLNARVILVSRNYLGSINHSLLTANYCKQKGLDVLGWIFNDHYMNYEQEIAAWSGYPCLASIPLGPQVNKQFIREQAIQVKPSLVQQLSAAHL